MELDKNLRLLGFKITTLSVSEIVEVGFKSNNANINCFNAHSYVVQKKNSPFSQALKESSILIPDGSGAVLSLRMLHGANVQKIAGYDLFSETMAQLNRQSGKVFMLGSSESVLERIVLRAQVDFPNVEVAVLSPPYKEQFSNDDVSDFFLAIEKFQPDVVFVGLTAPKQEILIHSFQQFKKVKFLAGIGAVFDFYAGAIERPSSFWIRLHLEWLIRFLRNPKHLWRRVLVSQPVFILDVLMDAIRNTYWKKKND